MRSVDTVAAPVGYSFPNSHAVAVPYIRVVTVDQE